MPPLPPRVPPPPRPTPIPPPTSVVVPQQLQPSSRTLLPLQPRLQLTPAHLSAAIAVVASQPVTPSPRPTMVGTTKKPLKPKGPRARLMLPAPLLAAASAAALALVTGDDDDGNSTTSPTHSAASSSSTAARQSSSTSKGTSTDKERTSSRAMKKCCVVYCESYARSRGLCKAHGGGKRCKWPGCDVSDQGGGFCIRHGGGKRCLIEGCDKSAQSRHYCKAHGGGARCRVDDCNKSSQGGGLCRAHGGGPRRKRMVNKGGEIIESPRTSKRTKYRAELAARALVGAAQTIEDEEKSTKDTKDEERIECEPGTTSLSFMIRRPVIIGAPEIVQTRQGKENDEKKREKDDPSVNGLTADGEGKQGRDHDDTHLFVAASLLGMQTASTK